MDNLHSILTALEPQVILGLTVPAALGCVWFFRRRRAMAQQSREKQWAETRALLLAAVSEPLPEGDARTLLTQSLQAVQQNTERVLPDADLLSACIALSLRLNAIGETEKLLRQAQQAHPGKVIWQDLEIDLLVARRSADVKSIERLAEACKRCPDKAEWHKRLLAWHISGGQPTPKSLDVLQFIAISTRDLRTLQFVCDHHERTKAYSGRHLSLFETICQVEKGKVKWLYALARCRHNTGDLEGAKAVLEQVLKLEPRHQGAIEFQSLMAAPPQTPQTSEPPATSEPSPPSVSSVSPTDPVRLPERYTQVTEIGRGGMGVVFRAFDQVLSRPVAIKTLNEGLIGQQEGLRERFLAESRTLAALDHPSIPKVFDVSVTSPCFITFEFISGESLRTCLERAPLPLSLVLTVGIELAEGFQHATERGVLHRDIKPENILIETGGKSHIVDFGLAKGESSLNLTQVQAIVGTPWYLAPERWRGEPASIATEIYAFGVTLNEMLCGKKPFIGDDATVVLAQEPVRPSQTVPNCPPRLEILILDCLSKNPNNRPASFAELKQELSAINTELGS